MNRTQTMNRVNKVRLIIEQEIMDGCNDCKNGGACTTHHLFFLELAINPRKYIDLDKCQLREGVKAETVRQASITQ